ncbi:MAG: DUF3089 domain-containing protein, partial [Solirubrobacteraceae bacterium]
MRSRQFLCVMSSVAVAAIGAIVAPVANAKTVWLCLPGHKPDPCTPGLSTTVYSPSFQKLRVEHPRQIKSPTIDCFYVYPTVSDQQTGNANLHIDPQEDSVAFYQAGRYSQYCKVYAPMYRQVTLAGIGLGTPTTRPNAAIALSDVEKAFETYLHNYNRGRGFVLIGHSQGSFILRQLIATLIDRTPAVRKLLVSAILMGGNVLVKRGKEIGGDFQHIPGCRSDTQLACVIAFSTFDQTPPSDTLFGRPPSTATGMQVLCTNPASLAGGGGVLDPISPSAAFPASSSLAAGIALLGVRFPAPPTTVWWSAPGTYSARCETLNRATVLEIRARDGAPTPNPSPTPAWGLHLLDANIALGNLLQIVKSQAAAFAA